MLVEKSIRRFEHPKEPGAWFELEGPLSAGDLSAVGNSTDLSDVKFRLLTHVLRGWSYDTPISPETVGQLDVETFNWLTEQVFAQPEAVEANPGRKRSDG